MSGMMHGGTFGNFLYMYYFNTHNSALKQLVYYQCIKDLKIIDLKILISVYS